MSSKEGSVNQGPVIDPDERFLRAARDLESGGAELWTVGRVAWISGRATMTFKEEVVFIERLIKNGDVVRYGEKIGPDFYQVGYHTVDRSNPRK